MSFQYSNISSKCGPSPEGVFNFPISAKTDVWRKPPNTDVFNAPMAYKTVPIKQFRKARVTIIGDWQTLYDQGGLIIVLPQSPHGNAEHKRWIKAGVEFNDGSPKVSVVAADLWADWSLLPLAKTDIERGDGVTISLERAVESDGSYGTVLKACLISEEGGQDKKTMIRELTWAFHEVGEDDTMDIGVYGARPTQDERETLDVKLKDFIIETA